MKRHFLLLGILTFLAGCGGTPAGENAACRTYWFGSLGGCVPETWTVLEQGELREKGAPQDAVVAFQAKAAVSGLFPTIAVTEERLTQVTTPSLYSEAAMRSVEMLPGYKLVDQRKVKIDGSEVTLHIFFAQPIATEPQRRFYQQSTAVATTGYTVTAMAPTSIKNTVENEILNILQSVTFVKAEEGVEETK